VAIYMQISIPEWRKFLIKQRLRNRLVRAVLPRMLHASRTVDLIRLGTTYGGWWVPVAQSGGGAIVYLAGAGEDISLDLALHERGCFVRVLDPTPRAIAYVRSYGPTDGSFRFQPVGLWDQDTSLRFYSPENPEHVSHSVVNLQSTLKYFEAEVRTLRTLMCDNGDQSIDLLKMDIEGAEHAVVLDILANGPLPAAICLEFDQPCKLREIRKTAAALRAAGYHLERVDVWNCTFSRTVLESRS